MFSKKDNKKIDYTIKIKVCNMIINTAKKD